MLKCSMSRRIRRIAGPIIGAAIGSVIPGVGTALGASLGSAGGTLASGGNFKQALLSAGGSYLGSSLGSQFLGGGNLGSALTNNLGNIAGNTVANALPAAFADASMGSLLGGYAGNSIGESLGGPIEGRAPAAPAGFSPSRANIGEIPASLQGMGALNPTQQASNLATQGTYGSGLGPDENQYFLNLVNRQLIDESGNVGDASTLNPIQNSYLQRLGLGGYSNSNNLLESISKWKKAA